MEGYILYTAYSEERDMTFIMEDVIKGEEYISTECKGFYYGKPDDKLTKDYYGILKENYK